MIKTQGNATIISDSEMVILRTWECRTMLERLVPRAFAMAHLNAGYAKVQVIDPVWDVIEAER